MAVSSFWAKLIESGSSAEQPSPARANVAMPSHASVVGAHALAISARVTTNGNTRHTIVCGIQRSSAANSKRPAVTMPQKHVSASDDSDAAAPKWAFIYNAAQLPFKVSHTP